MIGFTTVSLRSSSIEENVAAAVRAGADIIEWGGDVHVKTEEDAKKAKKLCDDAGILIRSYGSYYRTGSEDHEQWLSVCRNASLLGAGTIRAWLGTKGSADTDENAYRTLLRDARFMADAAKEYGITVSHECHPNTYNDTTESSLRFLRDVERENVKTYYQSWYHDEAGDKDKLFRLFPYVTDVHLSFSELVKFQLLHKKDREYINKILSWLKELDFNGGLIIEFTKNNSAENLVKDIKRLRDLWESGK